MAETPEIIIRPVKPEESTDQALVSTITNIINQAFLEGEGDLFFPGNLRTNPVEIRDAIQAGEMAVAESGDHILGCVRLRPIDSTTIDIGMLTVPASSRKAGLGKKLINYAETVAFDRGIKTVQVDVLAPIGRPHVFKDFLRVWYKKLGYMLIKTETVEEALPHIAGKISEPCIFIISQKSLTN